MPNDREYASYVPVPCVCKGRIRTKITNNETYEIEIYQSKLGSTNAPVYATAIHQAGGKNNYKNGDFVKVLVYFTFGGVDNTFKDVMPGAENHIIGLFQERSIANLEVENLTSPQEEDRIQLSNEKSKANVSVTDSGKIIQATSGITSSTLSPAGFGLFKEFRQDIAQNFHRWIAGNPPDYISREHFGMFGGTSLEEQISRVDPEDYLVTYRRFVTQTRDPKNWVSSCEGTWAPFVGANNNFPELNKSKEVLLSKVVNADKNRMTIECGEVGASFVTLRIDDVIRNEGRIETFPGATPAGLGNRFLININENGAIVIRIAGDGSEPTCSYGAEITIDEAGNMSGYAKGRIVISHSQDDESNNAIIMDPDNGIDIVAKNGFRVNGQELVTKSFTDWMNENQANLCQATSIGGPAPISPAALPAFTTGIRSDSESDGFTTKNSGPTATAILQKPAPFTSV